MYSFDNDTFREKKSETLENYTILTPTEVMGILNIGKNTAYSLLNSGRLKGFRIGRSWRVTSDALEEFMCSGNTPRSY